jgi:hypothetical protein
MATVLERNFASLSVLNDELDRMLQLVPSARRGCSPPIAARYPLIADLTIRENLVIAAMALCDVSAESATAMTNWLANDPVLVNLLDNLPHQLSDEERALAMVFRALCAPTPQLLVVATPGEDAPFLSALDLAGRFAERWQRAEHWRVAQPDRPVRQQ